jgi:hypothetical protein
MKQRPPITSDQRSTSRAPSPRSTSTNAKTRAGADEGGVHQPILRLSPAESDSVQDETADSVLARFDQVGRCIERLADDVDCLGRIDGRHHDDPPRPRAA